MSNIVPFNEMQGMAMAVTKSGMFGLKNENQALTLMLIAQAENIAPIQAIQMYSIINGMPSLKSTEVQSRFQRAGGKIQWIETTNIKASVKLIIDGNEYMSDFTMEDAKRMKLHDKDNYIRMPKQMMMARAITMGVRAIYPQCLNNMYTVDEMNDVVAIETQPLANCDDSFIEVDEIIEVKPKTTLKVEKIMLGKKLQDLQLSTADIKSFVAYYGIAEDMDAIEALNQDEDALLSRVKEFENQQQNQGE